MVFKPFFSQNAPQVSNSVLNPLLIISIGKKLWDIFYVVDLRNIFEASSGHGCISDASLRRLIHRLRDISKRADLQISERSPWRLIKDVSSETSLRSLRFSQRRLWVASARRESLAFKLRHCSSNSLLK